jgi:hypothetical protein
LTLHRIEAARHEEIEIDLPPSSLEQRKTLDKPHIRCARAYRWSLTIEIRLPINGL